MNIAKRLTLGACVLALAGCGGGESSTTTPTATGVLVDSAVAGVSYLTSGGFSGVTSANGEYRYNPGDTVTFKIGAITLGTVTATGVVTPIQLAGTGADSANKTVNLLVLLQSLDADNDPSNGITINASTQAAASAASALDLTQDPAQFASGANAALTTLMAGGGLARTEPVNPAAAQAHFKEEFFKRLKGGWVAGSAEMPIVFRFGDAGNYLHGEIGNAGRGGMSGTEVAKIDWNPVTGAVSLSGAMRYDDNGTWGLTELSGADKVHVDGNKWILTDTDGTVTQFTRVVNDPASLVGMWALNSATNVLTQTFTFFANGRYLMADPLGDTEGAPSCDAGGIEFGRYTFDVTSGAFAVTQAPTTDTNGCAGLWDLPAGTGSSFTFTFNADKSAFTLGSQTFYRVSN